MCPAATTACSKPDQDGGSRRALAPRLSVISLEELPPPSDRLDVQDRDSRNPYTAASIRRRTPRASEWTSRASTSSPDPRPGGAPGSRRGAGYRRAARVGDFLLAHPGLEGAACSLLPLYCLRARGRIARDPTLLLSRRRRSRGRGRRRRGRRQPDGPTPSVRDGERARDDLRDRRAPRRWRRRRGVPARPASDAGRPARPARDRERPRPARPSDAPEEDHRRRWPPRAAFR